MGLSMMRAGGAIAGRILIAVNPAHGLWIQRIAVQQAVRMQTQETVPAHPPRRAAILGVRPHPRTKAGLVSCQSNTVLSSMSSLRPPDARLFAAALLGRHFVSEWRRGTRRRRRSSADLAVVMMTSPRDDAGRLWGLRGICRISVARK